MTRFGLLCSCLLALGGCRRPADRISPRSAPALVAHPGSCGDCHADFTGGASAATLRPVSCEAGACHRPVLEAGRYAHAPVALGECLTCHVAHSSRHRALLIRAERELCASCHDELITCPVEQRSAATRCSECHSPHGGDDHRLLTQR